MKNQLYKKLAIIFPVISLIILILIFVVVGFFEDLGYTVSYILLGTAYFAIILLIAGVAVCIGSIKYNKKYFIICLLVNISLLLLYVVLIFFGT